jgi:hypothetical protein
VIPSKLGPKFGAGPHQFCGDSGIANANCQNCGRTLLHIATLDASADPLLIPVRARIEKIVLLFCWRCAAARQMQYVVSDGSLHILDAARGIEADDFPYRNYPKSFPEDRFSLYQLADEPLVELGDWNEISNDIEDPCHEFGGRPRLWQSMRAPNCANCDSEMLYFGTVANPNADPRGFTDNIGVIMLFFLCSICPTIYATNQVD